MSRKKIIFITGPTATGKSDLALALARRHRGEIVSCDSMQVYKEISIASNKPSKEELDEVPHHLLDVVSVTEDFDAAVYNRLANETITGILRKDKLPVVCGGSGMYIQILLDGIFKEREKNPALREQLKKRAGKEGVRVLYEDLEKVDPSYAEKIHPNDLRRIIRALEVYHSHGVPFSSLQRERQGLGEDYEIMLYGIEYPRQELYARINRRVDEMLEQGLVEEIKAVKGLPLSRTASAIIGVREISAFLEGAQDLQEAKEQMKLNTRRFAKRQLTWFRREDRLRWLDGLALSRDEMVKKIEEDL